MTIYKMKNGIKNAVQEMCSYRVCGECDFFNPNDCTDGRYFCHIRDKDENIPAVAKWDFNSAILGD